MKNLKRTHRITKNILSLLVLGLLFINFGNAAEVVNTEPVNKIKFGNPVLDRLISKINDGFMFNAHISSSTVKKNKNVEMPFTSFGMGSVNLKKGGTVHVNNIKTSFNDRNHFQSKTTMESLTLSSKGNKLIVTMKFHTWANQVIELSNVEVSKERFGYFIRGMQTNSTKTTYYTIAISHRGRLI